MAISEQTRKRLENQAAILNEVRERGPVGRTRIGEICGIRKASVTDICRDLIERGAIDELEPGFYRSEVELAAKYWKALAILVSSTDVTAAVVDHTGRIDARITKKTGNRSKPESYISLLHELISEALDFCPDVIGIGIVVPGIIDVERGICLSAVNLGAWKDVPLVEELSKNFPGIILENDAAAGLLGNHWFQEFDSVPEDFLYIALGQGIGCAQMSAGRLVRGQHFSAGEIGHLPAGSGGRVCSCGKADCLQTWCGESGLLKSVVDAVPEYTAYSLAEAGESAVNDVAIRSALKSALQPLAEKVATMVALVDPTAVIVACREPALSRVVPALLGATLEEFGLSVSVRPGLSPELASLQGGAVAVFRKAFEAENLRL